MSDQTTKTFKLGTLIGATRSNKNAILSRFPEIARDPELLAKFQKIDSDKGNNYRDEDKAQIISSIEVPFELICQRLAIVKADQKVFLDCLEGRDDLVPIDIACGLVGYSERGFFDHAKQIPAFFPVCTINLSLWSRKELTALAPRARSIVADFIQAKAKTRSPGSGIIWA